MVFLPLFGIPAVLVVLGLLVGGAVLLVVILRRKSLAWVLGLGGGVLLLLLLAAVALHLMAPTHEVAIQDRAPEAVAVHESRVVHEPDRPTAVASFSPVGNLAVLVVLGLLVGGAVLLVVRRRRKSPAWVLGLGGGVLLLLLLAATALHWSSATGRRHVEVVRHARDAVAVHQRRVVHAPDRPGAMASLSPPDVSDSIFPADLYPSSALAARAAATQLKSSVARLSGGGASLPVLHVVGKVEPDVLKQVADTLREDTLVERVEVHRLPSAEAPAPPGRDILLCAVRADSGSQGSVQLVLSNPAGQVSQSARFVAKPWAADFARYISESPQARIAAQSRRPCATLQEARQAALDDATNQILPQVLQSVDRAVAEGRWPSRVRPSPAEVRQWLQMEFGRGVLVKDRFAQRFARPYGNLWRQSLLIDASPRHLDSLASNIMSRASRLRRTEVRGWYRLGMTLGGLVVLIVAVYLVLNAATKGYYVWVLRLAAVALIAGGAVVVLLTA